MLIRKGNVELDVNEQFLQQYLNQGYDVIDASGKIIKKGVPNDITSLKAALNDADTMIDSLKMEKVALQNKISELENQLKEAKKKPSTSKK